MRKTFDVHVPDALASRIVQAATARRLSVERLVTISVEEMIKRKAQFESAAARLREKNAELSRQLSWCGIVQSRKSSGSTRVIAAAIARVQEAP